MSDPKASLRATTRAARRELDDVERQERSALAARHLLDLPELRHADTVLLYAATREEADPLMAWRPLVESGATVLFPRVRGDHLDLAAARDMTSLALGGFGILEPTGPVVAPTDVDVAVVPGLAFDRRGGRLGMGRGFYDRLLPQLRPDCLRVGFCFSCQVAVRVPMLEHDEGVDVVVTETAVHRMTAPPPATA